MKISRIIIIVLSAIVLLDLLFFVYVAFSDSKPNVQKVRPVIRIGVIPDRDRPETEKTIQAFFTGFHNEGNYELQPCYTHSHAEALAAFIHGSLDLLLINPASYLQLKRENKARVVAVQKYSEEEKNYNHSAFLTTKTFRHLNTTRGIRVSFSHNYSMNGYLVPYRYLQRQLPEAPEKWFSRINLTGSFRRSFDDLVAGKTDMIAVDLLWLKNYEPYQADPEKFRILWTSPVLPEAVICVSGAGSYFGDPIIQEIVERLWQESRKNMTYNRNSMSFEPENFDYETALDRLETFLYGDVKNTDNYTR